MFFITVWTNVGSLNNRRSGNDSSDHDEDTNPPEEPFSTSIYSTPNGLSSAGDGAGTETTLTSSSSISSSSSSPYTTVEMGIPSTAADTDSAEEARARKRHLEKQMDMVGFDNFLRDAMRKCYYMCHPGGEDGISHTVPAWSQNGLCKGDALNRVLDHYPDFKAIVASSNFGKKYRTKDQSALQAFTAEYAKKALTAMNSARSNFTRAIKRNFFQPGMDDRHAKVPDPNCTIYGEFQLAKGCLKNEQNVTVRGLFYPFFANGRRVMKRLHLLLGPVESTFGE